ncbi:5,6-dimethylbenzimidazole synthase [Litoribrevibacter albus]|uniref:5,6-dimethylbenzimidazole synthase n=1 Tax=Litoribrevibacter albus TaxID=1473156 RepID=A0AA37S7F3_9GAMM|nr:5,6-dimethylbenzimidazole synthase [Litoribrevibacter albus]GLQ29934.1 nitroreductase [Litoribrevibacter albus]
MESSSLTERHRFAEAERDALYKTVFNRRDVRGQFLPTTVPDEVLARVLYAAHHAPSVGFMQPWNFLVIRSQQKKQQVHQLFSKANKEAVELFDKDKQKTYKNLKLEGILESPINLCITCDRTRTGKPVLGRTHMKTMDLYSSVCAVQNLWLAARTEGLGVGWVSIMHEDELKATLGIPEHVVPIAYLCIGYVEHFKDKPELETKGWLPRMEISDLVNFEEWEGSAQSSDDQELLSTLAEMSDFPTGFPVR